MKLFGLTLSSQHFLALAVTAPLACGVADAATTVHPFNAAISFSETITQVAMAPCFLTGDITGQGLGTGLGVLKLVSHDCINPALPDFSQLSFASDPQLVLTAANGNKIFATYKGTFTIEGTVGVINGQYQIIGGTGRFTKATGTGNVAGVEDMITNKGQVTLSGTIYYSDN